MIKAQNLLLLSAALSGATASAQNHAQPSGQEPADERLNVLFIASDDLCSAMNAFGDPRVQTPNLDRLAQMGVVFNRAYNQSPLSGPSRASIMTGCRPDRTGVHDLRGEFRNAMPDAVTLPQLFKENGYYTARIGKIFHAGVPSDIGQPGSDDPASWTIAYNPIGRDKTDEYLLEGNTHTGTWMALDCNDNEMTDGISANVAVSILRSRYSNVGSAYGGPARKDAPPRKPRQPFFLAVGFYRPHIPYNPYELHNLAEDPAFRYDFERLKAAFEEWNSTTNAIWNTKTEEEWIAEFKPGGEAQKVAAPEIVRTDKGYELSCSTPGVSYVYKVQTVKEQKAARKALEKAQKESDIAFEKRKAQMASMPIESIPSYMRATMNNRPIVQDTSHWDLYHEPIEAEAGKVLSVKACRAGFTTSETVTVRMK